MFDLVTTMEQSADAWAAGLDIENPADCETTADLENSATRRAVAIGETPCSLPDWVIR